MSEWQSNLDEVISIIKLCAGNGVDGGLNYERWCWPRNADCKYVDIRIDMRDGHFILLDRHLKRISVEQLLRQSGKPWSPKS